MKKLKLVPLFSFAALVAHAQDTAADAAPAASFPAFLESPAFYFWLLMGSVLLIVIFSLVHAIRVLSKMIEGVPAVEPAAVKVRKVTAWNKLMTALTRAVLVEQEKDVLLDHDYDGIRELDNKLPPWWVWGFYVTIVFAIVYILYYHVGSGKLMVAEYNAEMEQAELEMQERIRLNANYVTAENVKILSDVESLKEGSGIYMKNCLACHGDKGQGNVGPNLTDAYWIHGGGIKNIFHTVNEGVPSKGMISWKAQLSPKQIQQVSSFILTMQGTNPEGAKEPQGELYKEITDSTNSTNVTVGTVQTDTLKAKAL